MSVARPISPIAVLLALTVIAALGFWGGFRDSFYGANGLRACIAGDTPVSGIIGAPVPLATALPKSSLPAAPASVAKAPVKAADKTDDSADNVDDNSAPDNTPDATDSTTAPVINAPAAPAKPKAEPKADAATADPGTETRDLPPLPKGKKPKAAKPAPTDTPAEERPAEPGADPPY